MKKCLPPDTTSSILVLSVPSSNVHEVTKMYLKNYIFEIVHYIRL